MGPRQSLSEVVGTHLVLACKWVITVFTHNTAPLPFPPPQSMLFKPKHIKPDEEWDTTLNRGRGELSFVEIQRFCGICPKTFETDCRSRLHYCIAQMIILVGSPVFLNLEILAVISTEI